MTRHRCGAPVQTRDPKRPWDTCRKFVAVEGTRCHLHPREKDERKSNE